MPGLHIDFTKEEYEAIPAPRRTWCREVLLREIRAELIKNQRETVIDRSPAKYPLSEEEAFRKEEEYAFKTFKGEFLKGFGLNPSDAWMRLGRSKASWTDVQMSGRMDSITWWEEDRGIEL